MSQGPGTPDGGVPESGPSSVLSRSEGSRLATLLRRREIGVLFAFLVLFGLIAVSRPDIFFEWDRMSTVTARLFRRVAPYMIIGIGMTFLIVGGEFDLSVGSMYALGGLSFAMFLNDFRLTVPAAVVAVLLLGVAVGLTNGVIVTKIGVPSLIATIGMLSLLRGLAFYYTPGSSRQVSDDLPFVDLFGGELTIAELDVNYQVFWAIGLLVIFGFVLQRTRFGYHVYATGDDQEAAAMTGIDTDRVKIANFVLTATLAAFAGVLGITYLGSMFTSAGQGFELLIIAAVVIGGTNLFGGEGSLTGTFLGALVIGVIPTLLILNNQPPDYTEIFTGAIIILAVVIDIALRK